MSEKKSVRLNKLAKEFNVSMDRILSFLENKGIEGIKPSSKIPHDLYMELLGEFQPDLKAKLAADLASKEREAEREEQRILEEKTKIKKEEEKKRAEEVAKEQKEKNHSQEDKADVKVLGKIDLELNQKKKNNNIEENLEEHKSNESEEISEQDAGVIKAEAEKLTGPKITGQKIDLDKLVPKKKPVATSSGDTKEQKKTITIQIF